MVSTGMKCVKYLIFCFNLIFALSGIAIITVGAIIQATYYNYADFVDNSYVTAPFVLIIVGVIVFVVAFFGCCGAYHENHCMIITFAVFLLVIFTLELATGIAGYVRHDEVEGMLQKKFNDTIWKYNTNMEIQKSWNTVQHDLKCCGINSSADWERIFHNETLPYTCCDNIARSEYCTTSDNIYHDGCLPKLKEILENKAYVIGSVGVGIGLIQLIGVAFACTLARSIRKEYETV